MHKIDLRRVDLNLLLVFDALMTEQSVTRAAARLSRTQSAVSHALQRLREQVGDPLLVKVGGRMRPSPRAEALIEDVRPLLAGIRRALAPPPPFDAATSERTFRIAIPDLTMLLFARLTASVLREAPGVALEWSVRDERAAAAVADGQIDLALMPAVEPLPDGVAWADAGAFRWASFVRRGHPAARHWGLVAWRKYAHVMVRVGLSLSSPVESAATRARERRVAAWVPHFSAVAPLLAHTDLIATLPLIAMADSLTRYDLVALPPPFAIPPMPHRLIWSRRLADEPGLCWLRERVAAVFSDLLRESEMTVGGRVPRAVAADAPQPR
jgi:DNA-binding transcriptional LysR family regulator